MNNKRLKIGFIARGLTTGGVTRFIRNVLGQFDQMEEHDFVIFTDTKNFDSQYKNINIVFIPPCNKLWWDYIRSFRVIRDYKLDAVLYTKNIIPITHFILKCKKINIVHDLAHFSREFRAYKFWDMIYMKSLMKISCRYSYKTVAISQNTKNDIINICGIDSKKITVVHEAVESKFKKNNNSSDLNTVIRKYDIKKPFMFYCGSLSPRKNIMRVLKAFEKIKDKIPHQIYLVSSKSWGDSEIKKYVAKNLSNRVTTLPYITEDELIAMYSMADLYLYPSLYEGFGLPILEAQACQCPLLTSNVTSCPEVAGDGGCIIDPYNESAIENAMLKVIKDMEYKNIIIKKGLNNLHRFDWRKTASELVDLIV